MNAADVKRMARELGADLCGIATPERLDGAPKGYHPRDVLPSCRSVIAFACRFPAGALACASPVPYTRIRNTITPKLDMMALELCCRLEDEGLLAVPIPTNESEWDGQTGRWRSVVSLKHAAQAAGLGSIGRHSLLITPEFGSMVWLGAVLTEAELEPDPLLPSLCDGCGLCVAACPIHALEKQEMAQEACWNYAFGNDPEKRRWQISCHRCRDACPRNLGSRNADMKRERESDSHENL